MRSSAAVSCLSVLALFVSSCSEPERDASEQDASAEGAQRPNRQVADINQSRSTPILSSATKLGGSGTEESHHGMEHHSISSAWLKRNIRGFSASGMLSRSLADSLGLNSSQRQAVTDSFQASFRRAKSIQASYITQSSLSVGESLILTPISQKDRDELVDEFVDQVGDNLDSDSIKILKVLAWEQLSTDFSRAIEVSAAEDRAHVGSTSAEAVLVVNTPWEEIPTTYIPVGNLDDSSRFGFLRDLIK